jgi:hypothetical protein
VRGFPREKLRKDCCTIDWDDLYIYINNDHRKKVLPLMTVTSMRYFACDGAAGGTPEMIKQMEQKLKIAFEPTSCKIVDPVGDMNSIVIKIVSPKF